MTKEKFDELREAIAISGKTVVVALGEMGIPKWLPILAYCKTEPDLVPLHPIENF